MHDVMEWVRARYDAALLLAALAVVAGVWGFIELADEVFEGETARADEWILLFLRNSNDLSDPLGPPWLEEAARDITALGSTTVIVALTAAVAGFLLLRGLRGALGLLLGAIVGGTLLSALLKVSFGRPRPDIVPHLAHVETASFPSGHSMLAAIVYLTLGALLARLVERRALKLYFLGVAALLALLVGISRVYVGVHYPTDVLAGWAAGLAWASLCWFAASYLQKRGRVEPPMETPDAPHPTEPPNERG